MPKFISNFKNKLIEHEELPVTYNGNMVDIRTPITVKPVITEFFGLIVPNLTDPNSPAGQAQQIFGSVILRSTLAQNEKKRFLDAAGTIRVQSGIDSSFIVLEPSSDAKIISTLGYVFNPNSDFSVKVSLIPAQQLTNTTLNNFDPNKNIIFQQDTNTEIITPIPNLVSNGFMSVNFRAPTLPPGSQRITTKIRCTYNGATAEILLYIEPVITPSITPLNSNTLINLLNSKYAEAKTNSNGNDVTASDIMLNMLPSITRNQSSSIIITVPNNLKSIFTNNPKYPRLSNSQENIYLATTTNVNGLETLDVSKLPITTELFNLVIPSLLPGSNIDMLLTNGTRLTIYRDQTNKISFNGTDYISILSSTTINNKQFTLIGIGSPVIFRVTELMSQQSERTSSNYKPSTIWEYLFYFAYPISFTGAIFYGFVSLVSVDPMSVILNRNWAVAFNIYIGVCAIISIFVWFKIQNLILPNSIFDQNVVTIHL